MLRGNRWQPCKGELTAMSQFQTQPQADANQLLYTKLAPPRPLGSEGHSSFLVLRTALLDRLDAALAHKLTLLSAPAGFGKTTLVSAWIQRFRARSSPVAFGATAAV
jgi:LuxR family maltose regulon positive regulatory protein